MTTLPGRCISIDPGPTFQPLLRACCELIDRPRLSLLCAKLGRGAWFQGVREVRFRRATIADQPALDAMMHTSNGYPDGPMRAMITRYHCDLAPRDGYFGYVLEDALGIAGFYTLMRIDDAAWELDLLFTDNARQGEGLGRTLMAHACDEARARGAARMIITSNPAAADFYRRIGARDIGVAPPEGAMQWERPRLEIAL